jgi:hypothetical protein
MVVNDYTALPYGLLSHKTAHGVDVFWYETSLGYPYSNGMTSQLGTLSVRVWEPTSTCKGVMRSGISELLTRRVCPSNTLIIIILALSITIGSNSPILLSLLFDISPGTKMAHRKNLSMCYPVRLDIDNPSFEEPEAIFNSPACCSSPGTNEAEDSDAGVAFQDMDEFLDDEDEDMDYKDPRTPIKRAPALSDDEKVGLTLQFMQQFSRFSLRQFLKTLSASEDFKIKHVASIFLADNGHILLMET